MSAIMSNGSTEGKKVVMTTCSSHCAGACLLKVHVLDGIITRIESDNGAEPQLRACLKGRAYRQRVYAPDRLLYPLKRVGQRGEGKFVRISWDEALETIAKELIRVRDTYGPESIFLKSSAGDTVALHGSTPFVKVLSLLGGFSRHWAFNSFEQGIFAELATFGTLYDLNSRDDLLNSKLIILWACDPTITVHNTNTSWYLTQARERGIRIIVVDPRYTDTAATLADQWISVIPGTDTALMIAMAYVMIKENLQDQRFLATYTIGFDKFRDYVMGTEDGVAKTPAWAEAITSVPAATIEGLARQYATLRPGALITGIAAGRTAYGEQYHRAAITLSAMTGNIGIHGGNAAGRSWTALGMYPFLKKGAFMPGVDNPVEKGHPHYKNFLAARKKYQRGSGMMPSGMVADALLKGKAGGYPADYKLLLIVNANYPNQSPDINKSVRALRQMEFIATVEQFMTPAAKWADIVLPSSTFLEKNDFTIGEGVPFFGSQNKAIEPPGETKSQLQMAAALAVKLGIAGFEKKTEEEVIKQMIGQTVIPDYDAFREKGIYRIELSEPYVAFRKEIEDPENNPFPTPSGKIEIYSRQLAEMNDPALPPVPKYLEAWESRNDSLYDKYPLQLITIQCRRRAHTQNETLPWLRETQTQAIQISPEDALSRGIHDGDRVRVFNERGITTLPARITKRIMQGVVSIPVGSWYDPDENGVDRGGNPNILLKSAVSPGGGFITNTCLVQVERG